MTTCPNTSSDRWKDLVEAIGEDKAYDVYTMNQDIPTVRQAKRMLAALNPVDGDKDANRFVSQSETSDPVEEKKGNMTVLSSERLNDGISKSIGKFLNSVGVQLKAVDNVRDINGDEYPALAKAEMVQKSILFAKGRLDIGALGEEAAHFYVEMLDNNSPLFKEMNQAIDKFDVYKSVVDNYGEQYKSMYGDDADNRIRREAIAQLINTHIIGDTAFESAPKQSFAIKWWDKLVQHIKSVFSKLSPEQYTDSITKDPYYKAAQDILTDNHQDLDLHKNLTGSYFQLLGKQKDIVDRIQDLDSKITLNEADHKYTFDGQPIKESVTEVVDRKNPYKGPELSPNEKKSFQRAGTTIHSYIENAVKRAIDTIEGKSTTQQIANNAIYDKLSKFITDFVNKDEFKGGKFLTEVKVVDPKRGVAGTIDLAIVMPDGKTHLFDWKSVNFKTYAGEVLDERVSPSKERNYNIQLGEYKDILKSQYGVSDFGQVRVIPIQTIFKHEMQNGTLIKGLSDVKVGGEDKHLQPIISEAEKTGIPSLDNLLSALIGKRHALENSLATLSGTDLERAKKKQFITSKLVDIAHTMTEIHTEHKINQFLDYMSNELDTLARQGEESTKGTLDGFTDGQFEQTQNNVKFFKELLQENLSPISDSITGESKERLRQLATRFTEADSLIFNEIKRRLQLKGEDVGISDVTGADKQTGWLTRTLRYASQQYNKKIATLYKLIDRQKQKMLKETTAINAEIKAKHTALMDWGRKNGASGQKAFDKLTNETGDRLVSKYSKDYWNKLNTAYDSHTPDNIDFLKKATNFDTNRYESALDDKIELWKDKYGDNKDAIDKNIAWFEDKYDVRKSDNAYGSNNYFLSPKDDPINHSVEYKYIHQKGNEALADYYHYFQDKTEEYRDVYGLTKDKNFIWNVRKDLIDRVFTNGLSAFKDMPSMLNQLEQTDFDTSKELLTDETGRQIQNIPKRFIQPILKAEKQADGTIKMVSDPTHKSNDLSKVLSLASAMAVNYKYMAEIEDSAKVVRLGIQSGQEITTDYRGRPVQDLIKGGVKTSATSAETIEQFNDMMNYYLYGVRNKTKDITFNLLGRKVSLLKAYSDVSKYFTGRVLGANPMSVLAHVVRGEVNARMIGANNRYFTNEQYSKAMYKMLPSRDAKAYAAIGYFDIMHDNKAYEKANNLSVNALTKNLTWDKLFKGIEKVDSWIHNSVLLGMMQNHTINEDGVVVKKTGTEKSLYDSIEVKDGKFTLPDLSEDEYNRFRRKVHTIGERLLGNTTRDNLRGSQLTIMSRSLMMFRSWIPRMADERLGELRHDYDLGEYEYGRYRAFAKTIFQDRLGNIASNLKNSFLDFGVLGFKPWEGANANAGINARIDELYYKSISEDPTLQISKDEFHDLYKSNLKSTMMELQLIGTVGMILVGLKGGVGQKKSSQDKFALSVVSKSLSEMAFYSGLGFNDIMQNGVPIMSLVTQIGQFAKAGFVDVFEGPQPKTHKTAAQRARDFFPISYAFDRAETMFEKGR